MNRIRALSSAAVIASAIGCSGSGSSHGSSASTTTTAPSTSATTASPAPIIPVTSTTQAGFASRFLYCANQGYVPGNSGAAGGLPGTAPTPGPLDDTILQLAIDPSTGALSRVGVTSTSPATGGRNAGTGAIATDPTERFLFALNFTSLDLVTFSIDPLSGSLTEVARAPGVLQIPALPGPALPGGSPGGSPSGSGSGTFAVSPDGLFLVVADTFMNQLASFSIGLTGTLTPGSTLALGPGVGPGNMAFDPSGMSLYVPGQASNTVIQVGVDATGKLSIVGSPVSTTVTAALGGATKASSWGLGPTRVVSDLAGEHLYTQNEGDQTITVFSRDLVTGALTATTAVGPKPGKSLQADATGSFLYEASDQTSSGAGPATGTIAAYHVEIVNGQLSAVSTPPLVTNGGLSQLALDFVGWEAFASTESGQILTVSIDLLTGVPSTVVSSFTYPAANGPIAMVCVR